MKLFISSLLLACTANNLMASSIVVDPDQFTSNQDISHASSLASILTTNGESVYAQELSHSAADGNSTQGLGHKVFGSSAGSEWFFSPGLEITFNAHVSHFSLLIAELYLDAGPGSEPIFGYVYDDHNQLLAEVAPIESTQVNLGLIDPDDASHGYWAYWTIEYSAHSIGKIIIGGNSEPTTIDRLTFDYHEVSEPNSLACLGICLFSLITFRRL